MPVNGYAISLVHPFIFRPMPEAQPGKSGSLVVLVSPLVF